MTNLIGKVVRIDGEGVAPVIAAALPEVSAQITAQWQRSRASSAKTGELRVLFPSDSVPIAAVALGEQKEAPKTGPDALPSANIFLRNENLERTRLAAAKGARALRDLGQDAVSYTHL